MQCDSKLQSAYSGHGTVDRFELAGLCVKSRAMITLACLTMPNLFSHKTSLLVKGTCLATLLGVGLKRLQRAETGTPDQRFGHQVKGTSAESDGVRAFFNSMYMKVAESLPDRFVRSGRARKRHTTHTSVISDESSEYLEAPSGDEFDDDQDLLQWLDKASDTPLHNATLHSNCLVKRYLPPGNLSELYDHYMVTQSLMGCNAASLPGSIW